ncbi:MAG: exo-alpha-sialidase [Gemmatimonadota bacterium]|nr:exo-alpha-sialidase [Gemmatimonadota bacterium]MDE3173859.1 exo-alpha-sialidase [Gemmatimonadota bacterium]MDE3216158.1 exo-alpha-sialidase [Gemmatimonadota bacterium]
MQNSRMIAIVLAAACPLVAAAPLAAQRALPRPPGARVVDVSPPSDRGNEPSIAVDPRDPARIVAVYQGPPHVAYSTDSGRTFSAATGTVPQGWHTAGDVTTTFDDRGNAYVSSIVFDHLGTPSYWRHGAGRNGIVVRRSPDGGRTWDAQAFPIREWPTDTTPGLQFEDMPRLFADNQPASPHRGTLYAGWIEWQIDRSIMLFSRSTDQGRTWSAPIRVSTQAGYPRDDNGDVVGFMGTIGPDGTIYAVWNWGSTIVLTTSRDGGRTFAPSRPVLQVGPAYFGGTGAVPDMGRVFGFPQVGVAPRGGRLYLCWSDYRHGDIDVFVASSADKGRTFSAPVRVNSDSLHDGRDQFLQWMAVDPVTGDVYVQFYDRRGDPRDLRTGFTLARSTDGGRTFVNYDWSGTTFLARGAFLGDYTWLTAYDGRVYGVWAETVPADSSNIGAGGGRPARPETVVRVGTADFHGMR